MLTQLMCGMSQTNSRITVNSSNKVRLTGGLISDSFVSPDTPYSVVHLIYNIILKINNLLTVRLICQCARQRSTQNHHNFIMYFYAHQMKLDTMPKANLKFLSYLSYLYGTFGINLTSFLLCHNTNLLLSIIHLPQHLCLRAQ